MSQFRRIWACSLLSILLLTILSSPASAIVAAQESTFSVSWPRPGAAAAALIEAESGQLLFAVNGAEPLPPASTTKILTALLALDLEADLQQPCRISPQAAAVPEASVGLRAGETLTLADLLTGALVHSGNDACYAVAEAVAGGERLFVHWLNMKAMALGAYSVHFTNTNGLPDERHLISAVDLALLSAAAMEQDFFAETVAGKYGSLGESSSYRRFRNTNKLLWQDEHIIGVKTGTTDAAGPCLVAAYQQGAACYISVVLHSPDRYGESYALLRYAEDNYIRVVLAQSGQLLASAGGELLYAADDLSVLLRREEAESLRLRWSVDERQARGSLALLLDKEVLAEIQLLPAQKSLLSP